MKFVKAAKESLPQVDVWGTGRPVREWLYVKDFAAIVRRVVETREASTELVNIAQNRGHSVRELVDKISEMVGYSGQIVYDGSYQDGSPKRVMDDRRFMQRFPAFGFTDLAEGIVETIAYYREMV
ncbi:MAG: NAD-dependent epimerase/dehydratase family protein [Chloroflexi bacterium]|nr:NAD-dependent epimerase/dehydratase family protein [Chloroflexota bacterium]